MIKIDIQNGLEKMAYHIQEKVNMWTFVHEKSHWMTVNGDFDCEVVRRSWFHRIPGHCVMMRVYQCFVQIEHERLALHHSQAMARNRGQWKQIIFHRLILYKLDETLFDCSREKCRQTRTLQSNRLPLELDD